MIWLKAAFALFTAVLVPVYWRTYGPANFLWISDVALFLTAGAVWLESPLLAGTAVVAALPFELAWNVEYFVRLATGRKLFGLTDYMFRPELKRWIRGLSLFHAALPPVWIGLLAAWGYDRRALPAAVALLAVLAPLTALLTDPDENVNWVFLPRQRGWRMPIPLWLALYVPLVAVVFFWPVHAMLTAFA